MNSHDRPERVQTDRGVVPVNGCRTARALIVAAMLTGLSSGCGISSECQWPATETCRRSDDNLAGTWAGTWESHDHGYRRNLRAEFTPCGTGEHRATYEATIGGMIPIKSEAQYSTIDQGGATCFSGTAGMDSLLPAGCRYNGSSDGVRLVINYWSAKDFGVIRLTRSSPDGGGRVSKTLARVSAELLR